MRSPTEPRDAPGISSTTTSASTPRSSPKYAEYSCTLTGSSPHQFTIVAGTLAASSSGSSCAQMSSSWIGLYGIGSQRVRTGSPAAMASRCQTGRPLWSLYAAPMRAMVTGRSNERAQ